MPSLNLGIRALREERSITQEGLAEAAGLHAKSVSRLEQGGVNATLATLVGVADALGVPLRSLFPE